ncbi:unnamed protein product [Staurois parvus]|uniref:ATP synthase F0 subunit 8 n=1 Tax=Staurois parvus TaxID=386267 RepID=A0ABN9FM29_9NEOB|nr:unnamed protein product [Staurois parvus]
MYTFIIYSVSFWLLTLNFVTYIFAFKHSEYMGGLTIWKLGHCPRAQGQ